MTATARQESAAKVGTKQADRRPRTKKRLPGRPPKSGARSLSRFIRRNLLDRRTWVSQEVEATADRYASDGGGWNNLTHRERGHVWLAAGLFVELCVRQSARLSRLAQGKLDVDDSDKHYGWLYNSYTRIMDKLQLRPDKVDRLPDLAEYLREKRNANGASRDGSHAADDRPAGMGSAGHSSAAPHPEAAPEPGDDDNATQDAADGHESEGRTDA